MADTGPRVFGHRLETCATRPLPSLRVSLGLMDDCVEKSFRRVRTAHHCMVVAGTEARPTGSELPFHDLRV